MATKVPIRRGALTRAENKSGHKFILVIALIVVFALGLYDGGAGLLQKHVFPKRYWTKQLGPLQDELQRFNKLAADNAVLLGQADLKAKLAVAQVLQDGGYSQAVIDTNKDEIEKTKHVIAAMSVTEAKKIAGYLEELICHTQGKLVEAGRQLGKREGKPRVVKEDEL